MTIKAYRADGATASIDTAGLSETVVFRVEGLRYKSPASWMHEALHASGLPRPGEAHPVQTGVQVLGLNAERVTADIARVRVSYGVPTDGSALAGADPGTIDIAATTQVEVVSTSQYGVPIQVSYTSVVLDSDGNEAQVTEAKGVEVEVYRPQIVLRYTRMETRSPGSKSRAYLGSVNSRSIWNGGARDWLCTDYSSSTEDRGLTFRVNYEFTGAPGGLSQRRRATLGNAGGRGAGGWDAQAIFIDSATGAPPVDLVAGKGIKTVQVYPQIDFSGLRLPRLM